MTQPFYFPDGRLAHDANDLFELCQQYPDAGVNYLIRQDLEKWLAYIGNYDVAECAINARQTDLSDRQKLEEFLNKCHSLVLPKSVPAAVTESASMENQAATTTTPSEGITEEPVPVNQPAELKTEEGKDLAVAELTLSENEEPARDNISASSTQSFQSAIDEGRDLAAVESTLTENSQESTATPTPVKKTADSGSSSSTDEKPSFFQIIAKFIVKILYRNKA